MSVSRHQTYSIAYYQVSLSLVLVEMQSEAQFDRLLITNEHKQGLVDPMLLVSDEVPSYKCCTEESFILCSLLRVV